MRGETADEGLKDPEAAAQRRREREASLRERERQLEEALGAAGVGIWNWDCATDTVTWSDELYRIQGRPRSFRPASIAELRAKRASGPESWGILLDAIDRTMATGLAYELDIEIVRPTGEHRWIIARGARDHDEYGAIKGIRGTAQDITDRKLAELELAERERELREVQHAARLGTWRWEVATDKTTWSEEVYRAFGYDPQGPAPGFEALRKLHSPESGARLEAMVKRALTTGEGYREDVELLLPNGERRWIAATGEVEYDTDGRPAALRGMVQDITERKLVEQQVILSENRYRSLVEVSSDLVWTTNPDVEQLVELPAWQAFTGQSNEELMGFGWSNAIHPDDRESTIRLWAESVASGKHFQMEHRLRRHDGVYRVMSVSAVPSRDATGKIVEWVGMHTDITQRVEAETALRQANSRFQKLYDANLIGICYPDRFGAFSGGNAEFLRIVGYSAEDLEAGRVRWDTMTPPEYAETDRAHIAEAASRGSCTPYEKEYFRKDGTRVPILCGYALHDGSTDQYIGFIMDLSRLKQTEDALRRSEKLAATGRLAASIAHEINNPLEAVTNSLYLGLTDPTLTDTTRSYLELAERELARVAQVATQTLRFHRQSTAPAPADLGEIMDSAYALFSPRFEACSIQVTLEYCDQRTLFCFMDEIRQVFANLLSNALDATRPGGKLRLRIRNTHDWRGEKRAALRVSVADTGHGIPAKVQDTIFEPFMTTKDATGTGLGLWVSDGIVKKHKGRFVLRSSTRPVGHGTVFWIYFPLDGLVAAK